jgi:hypothetical protein
LFNFDLINKDTFFEMLHPMEGIREVLLTLSWAFDNFVEASVSNGNVNNFDNFDDQNSNNNQQQKQHGFKVLFNRPNRKMSSSSTSRKRSWEVEMEANNNNNSTGIINFNSVPDNVNLSQEQATAHYQEHHGKRSKSLVLAQELEDLRLSTISAPTPLPSSANYTRSPSISHSSSKIEQNLKGLAEQDLAMLDEFSHAQESTSGPFGGIDNTLRVLCHFPKVQVDKRAFTDWLKWSLDNEVAQSIRVSEKTKTPIRFLLTRLTALIGGLLTSSMSIDWSDPELVFLLTRLLRGLLSCDRFLQVQGSSPSSIVSSSKALLTLNRRLEELFGLLRILNLFLKLPIKQDVFEFLLFKPETSLIIIEFHESFLEITLNVFELVTTINSSLGSLHHNHHQYNHHNSMNPTCIATAFALLLTKSIDRFRQQDDQSLFVNNLISKIINLKVIN